MSDRRLPHIALRCLGTFDVTIDAAVVTAFPTDKIRALFTYLALEARPETGAGGARPHRREVLAGLFWPEMTDDAALANLRLAIHRLRKTLDRVAPGTGTAVLLSTRQTVQLNHSALAVDATTFQALLAESAAHTHRDLPSCPTCMAHLSEAVELYRGELLAGFGLADAPTFEEWLLLRREMLHQQAVMALHSLVAACEQRGDYSQAHLYASRQLTLDPYREEAHRQLMSILARRGLYTEALAQYDTCRRTLREELGVEPSIETIALYEQIRTNRLQIADRRLQIGPENLQSTIYNLQFHDWGEAPQIAKCYGRQAELAQLERWLVHDRCQIIAVLGMGGVGKTTLVVAAASAVAAQFDAVIWRSLLNAPPLDELLRDILRTSVRLNIHSSQRHSIEAPVIEMPAGLDALLPLLIEFLRQRRCLLVFDNLESILQPDLPGQVRPGYDGYTRLIQSVAEQVHHSCLLLTSREWPQSLAGREGDTPLVRTLPLDGLDAAAGQAMLTARGLSISDMHAAALVQRYSGNPLALKLVAQTVRELFGGHTPAFLAAEAPIFDDIRIVLDQQFARLSPLEQELLIWLAVEREPVTAATLRDNLAHPVPPRAFLEALRALQRRSLLAPSAHGFVLQNVVTEYLTDVLVDQVCREIEGDFGLPILDFGLPKQPSEIENPKSKIASPLSSSALNRYALLKATAKEYVRASQARLILEPVASQLLARLGRDALVGHLNQILAVLRAQAALAPGYAAGNILNLLLHLGVDLCGYDFSRLNVWQAYLQGMLLPGVNFREANLAHSVFTHIFGEILAIRFDAEQQLLVAGVVEGKLCLWRAADRQLLREYQTLGAGATIATFSHDGRTLASGDTDHQVRLWDVAQGQLLHTLSGHTETPWALMFSPDGTMLASSGVDGVVHLWDVRTGRLRQTLQGHTLAIPALAFTIDGQTLASGDTGGAVSVWRVGTPEPLHMFHEHTDEVHALVFDATGTLLASGSHDRTIRLWDVGRGQMVRTLKAHTEVIRTLAMSPDGHTLASGGGDTFVCLWDVHSGRALHTLLDLAHRNNYLSFSANGQTLATVGADQTICLWNVATGQRLDSLQAYSNLIYSIDFSPDGRMLASGGMDCIIRLWDVETAIDTGLRTQARIVQALQGHTSWIYSVAFSPDGATLASASCDRTIRLWDIRSGCTIRTLHGHTDDVEAIQFSPDGQLLLSASRDTTLRVWDVRSGRTIHTLHGHTERVYSCAFSPDGHTVASGSIDRTVRLWDIQAGGQAMRTLRGHTNAIRCVAFNRDGRTLASSGFDQTVRLWDTESGRSLATLPVQDTITTSIAFHPNGELLATGAKDYAARLWDAAPEGTLVERSPHWSPLSAARMRNTLHGHTNSVETIRFSPDGRWVASGSADETIRLWDVATGACLCILRADGPYAGMNITGVTGISDAQKAVLVALGAVEEEPLTITAQLPTLRPRPQAAASPQHNLPAPLSSFVGRADELARVAVLLNGDTRLVTLVGAGGVGKTRLALAAAGALRGQFAEGTWWVALAGVQPADDAAIQRTTLASAIATALGRTLGGRRPPLDELADALRDCAALLVLDNCEHLPEVAAVARALLETAPKLRVLATSREPLGLGGEALLRLDGLPVPEAGAADPDSYPGVRLFLERAARHTPSWRQDAAEVAAVARLCRLLDGLPLAIELAAHWVGHYTPDEISAAIQTDLDFLAARTRDVPDRHRSLRAVFDYTWSLLTAAEQQGLARLSVFHGTFDRAAVQAVAGVRTTTLVALVDKSLVRQAEVGRYNLHELLRQFAAERLDASGEAVATRVEHAAHYLALAEATTPTLAGAQQAAVLARLEMEHDNLRAALAWARERGEIELGLRLAGALWPFWQRHCHLAEGRRWLEGFLAVPDAGAIAPEVRATVLIGAGWLAHDQDDYVRADALFEEGLRLEQALGHTGRAATVLAHRGLMALWQGQYTEATALVEESLALARAAGDRAGVAYALFRLGLVTRERGDYSRATSIYQECLAAYQALGDRSGAAFALLGLGDIARDQGDAAQLEVYCAESLAVSRELGHHWSVGFSLNNLALAAMMRGDLPRAAALAEEALNLFRAHGIRGGVVETLITRGQIACAQGDYAQARTRLAEGMAQGWPGGPHWLVATGLEQLARVALAAGQAAQAAWLCAICAAWRSEMGAPLPPYRRATYETTLAAARRTLGEDGFATAWAEGAAMQPEHAISTALAAAPAE